MSLLEKGASSEPHSGSATRGHQPRSGLAAHSAALGPSGLGALLPTSISFQASPSLRAGIWLRSM